MMRFFSHRFLLAALLMASCAHASKINPALNLQNDGASGKEKNAVILILYTASYCHYCVRVKAEVFNHIEDDPRYRSHIILREVIIDSEIKLQKFDGSIVDHSDFAKERGILIVPTLEIVNPKGHALTEPLVGAGISDFYGFYVEQRISDAVNQLNLEKNPS